MQRCDERGRLFDLEVASLNCAADVGKLGFGFGHFLYLPASSTGIPFLWASLPHPSPSSKSRTEVVSPPAPSPYRNLIHFARSAVVVTGLVTPFDLFVVSGLVSAYVSSVIFYLFFSVVSVAVVVAAAFSAWTDELSLVEAISGDATAHDAAFQLWPLLRLLQQL